MARMVRLVEELGAVGPGARWLDFGCGLGGLLRYCAVAGPRRRGLRRRVRCRGDAGRRAAHAAARRARRRGGTFDVVTAIEVVEHVLDPLDGVHAGSPSLAPPGGLVFLTTGNARPYRGRLTSWQYVRPEVHVSFYEPETLQECMRQVGLQPQPPGYRRGFTDVIRSKVLRTVGVHRRNVVERCVPWPLVSRVVDRRFGVTPAADRPAAGRTRGRGALRMSAAAVHSDVRDDGGRPRS